MNTLPCELVTEILSYLPSSSLVSSRLVNHRFSVISFPFFFAHIPQWLDYKLSHQAISSIVGVPLTMWSPWALEPDTNLSDTWLRVLWLVLMKQAPIPADLTGDTFAGLSGYKDLDGKRLRMGQNRFLLYRKLGERWDWGSARAILDWGVSDPAIQPESSGVCVRECLASGVK